MVNLLIYSCSVAENKPSPHLFFIASRSCLPNRSFGLVLTMN